MPSRDTQQLFNQMPHGDVISWTALLIAYDDNRDLASASVVFDDMPRRNTASWNTLLSVYLRAAWPSVAYSLFSKISAKNTVSYGAMIWGLAKAGILHEAEVVYEEMPW